MLNETITEFLSDEGYDVVSLYDGIEAQNKLYESRYDLLLLDVNTPGIDGFKLLQESREGGVETPAIYITSMNSVEHLERGFECGCDDYLRKPFAFRELKIRIETLLKRDFYHKNREQIIISEMISYDIENHELIIEGKPIALGQKESTLLKLFMKHPNEVIAHERIFEYLWNYDEEPSDVALRTYIKNIRKLIGKEKIVSLKKQGYKFVAQK